VTGPVAFDQRVSRESGGVMGRGGGPNQSRGRYIGMGIAIGAAFGVSLGLLLDNLAVGIGMGVAIGLVVGASLDQRSKGGPPPGR